MNVQRCSGTGRNGGQRLWQPAMLWGKGTCLLVFGVQWHSFLNVRRFSGAGGDGGRRQWQWAQGNEKSERERVNGKHSKFVVCLLFLQYLLHLVQAF